MTAQQNQSFALLLETWNRHQDMRTHQAPIAELAASRSVLDQARLRAAKEYRVAA